MDLNYTLSVDELEQYSLTLIEVIDNLPDTFFINRNLAPSNKTIDFILSYSKKISSK